MDGTVAVLNDPQFSLTAILRPYAGFDAQTGGIECYQGVNGLTPIMFTEGGVVFDPQAGSPGYSKRLLKGLTVPYGARIVIWLPAQLPSANAFPYNWNVIWRQRNVFDYRVQRIAFHYPKQGVGVADPTVGDQPSARVVIPACSHSIVATDPNPASSGALSQVLSESFQPRFPGGGLPLAPQVSGIVPPDPMAVISQGLFPNLGSPITFEPTFLPIELQALGDELLLQVSKPFANGVWDFTGGDLVFSFLFGTAIQPNAGGLPTGGPFLDLGVYVNVGVAT
jgi:hypothetical protein